MRYARPALVPIALMVVAALGEPVRAGVRDPIFVEVDRSNDVEPGSGLTVSGGGWDADSRIELVLSGTFVGNTTVGPNGYFETIIQVPELEDGEYELEASGAAEGERVTRTLTLRVSDDLIRGAIAWYVVLGLVLLALVAAAWFFILRPRRPAERPR